MNHTSTAGPEKILAAKEAAHPIWTLLYCNSRVREEPCCQGSSTPPHEPYCNSWAREDPCCQGSSTPHMNPTATAGPEKILAAKEAVHATWAILQQPGQRRSLLPRKQPAAHLYMNLTATAGTEKSLFVKDTPYQRRSFLDNPTYLNICRYIHCRFIRYSLKFQRILMLKSYFLTVLTYV
jgi:hypothetical protein